MSDAAKTLRFLVLQNDKEGSGQCRTPLKESSPFYGTKEKRTASVGRRYKLFYRTKRKGTASGGRRWKTLPRSMERKGRERPVSDAVENPSTERKERERPVSDAVEILFYGTKGKRTASVGRR